MFSFGSRKLVNINSFDHSTTCFLRFRDSSIRFISNATEEQSLIVDYLIKRCGLTQESALKTSKKIRMISTTKADSVLALFTRYGLPKPCISKLISAQPRFLSGDPSNYEPKIQYFLNMGISVPDLARFFSRDPNTLASSSLKNRVIPSMEFLKSLFKDGKDVVLVLSRLRWNTGFKRVMEPNIEFLRYQGVPEHVIMRMLKLCPQVLTWKQSLLNEAVLKAKEIGFDPTSLMFVHAMRTLLQMNGKIDARKEVFRSFGWSENEILCMFRKQPYCLTRSEKVLRIRLDFFMNKLGLTTAQIITNPVILLLSMEKRTIPRCSVIQVLLSQGLMKRKSICNALTLNEDRFLERFVKKHDQELPQLLKEYKCNMDCLGYWDL